MRIKCTYCYTIVGEVISNLTYNFIFKCPKCGQSSAYHNCDKGEQILSSNENCNSEMLR